MMTVTQMSANDVSRLTTLYFAGEGPPGGGSAGGGKKKSKKAARKKAKPKK